MEEWKEYKLGEVVIPVKERIETSCLDSASYISTENMLPDKAGVTLSSGVPSGNAVMFKNDDILISNIRPYFKKIWRANRDGGCSSDVICLRASNAVDPLFLYYLLCQDLFFDYIMQGAKGTKMPRGDRNQIMQWPVLIPSKNKQHTIASILCALDDKIEVNRRINDNFYLACLEVILIWLLTSLRNDNLEQQAQALFKSWFVDFDPFKDGEFVESELGMIPKGWRAGTLSEIANITMGTSPSGASYNVNGEGEVFYQGRAEFGYRFPRQNMYTTEPKRYAEDGDVLLSVRAPVGDVNIANERCCIGRGLAAIGSESCPSYILYLVKSLKSVFEQYNGEGTVFGSINKKTLEGLHIIVPESKYIERFEKVANPLDGQIRCKEEESRRLASLRDTLLPKLMSGELKLNEVNV